MVCARNERRTIRAVVRTLKRSPQVGRVIVVDDCSRDGTGRKARLAGAKVIKGPGIGKGEAMAAGLRHVRTPRVMFVDGDIRGLTRAYVARLAKDNGGMVTGLRDNGSRWFGPFPPISGERSMPVWLPHLAGLKGYGAETALNAVAGRCGLPCETFRMPGVTNPRRAPLRRTVQVLRAASRHVLGLAQYMAAWLVTTIGALAWG